ncbi:MAG: TIGR00282 family metallophosphoesterase [bacterium]|nr:TIGR00282 family metallophosphoesterase [bacterium]
MFKVLFIGDIVGSIGRQTVAKILPKLKKKLKPDLVIANVENIAHGKGITEITLKEIFAAGVDAATGGNHSFARKQSFEIYEKKDFNILRPANFPPGLPGNGEKIIQSGNKSILLLNLMGRVFMSQQLDCPFRAFDAILKKYEEIKLDAIIVDFHAEATSEKKAFAAYVDGRANIVFGTHTHVQTADEMISKKNTGSISDVGMVGLLDSVLGVTAESAINNFLQQTNQPLELAKNGRCIFNSIFAIMNLANNKIISFKKINEYATIK